MVNLINLLHLTVLRRQITLLETVALFVYIYVYFKVSKNVKTGIKCLTAVSDIPHKDKKIHWIPMDFFVYFLVSIR